VVENTGRQVIIVRVDAALKCSDSGRELLGNARLFFQAWICSAARRYKVKIGDKPVFDALETTLIDCGITIHQTHKPATDPEWVRSYRDFCSLLTERLSSRWLEDFVLAESSLTYDSMCIRSVKESIIEDDGILEDLFLSYSEIDEELEDLALQQMKKDFPNIVTLKCDESLEYAQLKSQ